MDIAALEALADTTKAADAPAADPAPGAAPGAASGAPRDEAREWAQVPAIAGSIFSAAWPELDATYSEEKCLAWGRAMVPVAARYGWEVNKFLEWLGPWVMLAVASKPFVADTWRAAKKRLDAARAAQTEQQQADRKPAPVT